MIIIKTYRNIEGYCINQFKKDNPSCFNGLVCVEKYKITSEKIKESKEVYQERLQHLWDLCDNHHHWNPLQAKARELGITLVGKAGSKRSK